MSKDESKTLSQSNTLITNYTVRYSNAKCPSSALSLAEAEANTKKSNLDALEPVEELQLHTEIHDQDSHLDNLMKMGD